MRVLALHPDVIVFVSAIWQTTCTAVRAPQGGEGFLIDSPVLPEELEALPNILEQAGFAVSALIATHADWDHLLARTAFPDRALGISEPTAARLRAEPGQPARDLRSFDEEHYVAARPPLALQRIQCLPVPGKLELGDAAHELELHPVPGHTSDGTAILIPWASTLVCGDYLSPVEIPMITDRDRYAATLHHLRALVQRADTVVPGHGAPVPRDQALSLLAEDLAYVNALPDAALPPGRRTQAQKRIHAKNQPRR